MEHRGKIQQIHNRQFVSVVVSAYNEEDNVEALWAELAPILEATEGITEFEVIYVDDGSSDSTFHKLLKLKNTDPRIKVVQLLKNSGHEMAMTAGMDYAKGDCVIFMDADLQHPPEVVPKMIKEWRDGNDIVLTRRMDEGGGSFLRGLFYNAAYMVLNWLQDEKIPQQSPDFRLLDRCYVDTLKNMDERDRMLRGLISWAAPDDFVFIPFTPRERLSGESKYNFSSLFKLGIDGIVSFTVKPLQFAIYLGVLGLIFATGLAGFTIWHHFAVNPEKTGFATVLIATLVLSSIQLLVLGIHGVYLGRIHFEVKKRPLYVAKYFDSKIDPYKES